MIHTASLVHDDIIDLAYSRRGKPSTHYIWGEKEAVLAGNYIMSRATIALARLGNTDVIQLLSKVLDDLVKGNMKYKNTQFTDMKLNLTTAGSNLMVLP